MDPHHQNEWTKDPECNPGGESSQTPDDAVRFKLLTTGRAWETEVVRLAPESEEKRLALEMISGAIRLLTKE